MEIQRLSPAHASEYRALMLEAYERHPDAFASSVAERAALPLSWWEERLEPGPQPSQLVLGAFDGGDLAGAAGLTFESREKERHKARLYGLSVAAAHRRRGLGSRLVEAVLAEARARPGVRLVQLTVAHPNPAARALYERAGFVQFGLEPLAFAAGDRFVAKLHMWCDLGGGDLGRR